MRVSFESDYNTGAHPSILRAFLETNLEPTSGYGEDRFTKSAKEKIAAAVGLPGVEIELLTGGTQTNMIVISSMLADFEGVIAAETGHIAVHEAGAIENAGKKVLTLPAKEGKITAAAIDRYVAVFHADPTAEHMVIPGMVYLSQPTEYGTLYSRAELSAISAVCRKWNMRLYVDGARLGYALASAKNDVALSDLASLTDVFYIGGTKVGALCGEAVVFTHGNKPKHFQNFIKKRGALLAKGRLVGIQFDTLFTDNLYQTLGKHALVMTEELRAVFAGAKIPFFIDSPTNQQFVILTRPQIAAISKVAAFEIWAPYDKDSFVCRFVCGWSTKDSDIQTLAQAVAGGKAV